MRPILDSSITKYNPVETGRFKRLILSDTLEVNTKLPVELYTFN